MVGRKIVDEASGASPVYVYMILTENKRGTVEFLKSMLKDATIFTGLGICKGLLENSLAVLIMSSRKTDDAIHSVLQKVRRRNRQSSVIAFKMIGEVILVTSDNSLSDNRLPDNAL